MRCHIRALVFALLSMTSCALAHVGSPDVFYEGDAGPYHLLVTVRPPAMIPGVASVEIRSTSGSARAIQIFPIYITGKESGFPPTPDRMQALSGDPQTFRGRVWLMASGSWEIRAEVDGTQGKGELALPVAAFARRTLPMQKALGALLFGLMLFLSFGIVFIAGAATREGQLEPGASVLAANRRRGRIAMLVTTVIVLGMLALGNWWWSVDAADLSNRMLYKAPPLSASLDNGNHLTLRMGDSNWHSIRKASWSMRLVPDHGHVMHLFLLRLPTLDRFYHLHPEQVQEGIFEQNLPSLPAGHYQIFADVVRESGFPDTMVSEMDLPEVSGKPMIGDDSGVDAAGFTVGSPPLEIAPLSDGGRMVWEREASPPSVGRLGWFRFRIEDSKGQPVTDGEPYMGMAGHAVFVRSDQSVFAHVHPAGSVPMAALAIVHKDTASHDHAMAHGTVMPSEVSFPYGFPRAGDYRIFVQVKRGGRVETGVFDTRVGD